MKKMSFLVLLVGLIVSSCSEDKLTRIEMLTGTGWNLASGRITVDGVEQPGGADIEVCDLDDIHTFMKNGTYTLDPGENLCWEDDTLETGTWAFFNDETEFLIDLDGEASRATIDELTESVFRFSIKDVDEDGVVYIYNATFNAL